MILRDFSVKGFRSIEEIEFKNLDRFNVFVGENNAGKSNILDAIYLFISNITSLNASTSREYPDELWPGATRNADIEWGGRFAFATKEFGALLDSTPFNKSKILELLEHGEFVRQKSGIEVTGPPHILLHRVLRGDEKRWQTKEVEINQLRYYSKGEWAVDRDREFVAGLDNALVSSLAGRVKYVGALPGSVSGGYGTSGTGYSGVRSSFVRNETVQNIVELFSNWNDANQKHVQKINEIFRILAQGCQVDAKGNTLFIDDGQSSLPIQSVGGGIQEMLQLAYDITEESDILLLEEPELHLHPRLTQNVFRYLKKLSHERQIFVATHSTTFIDQAELSNIWLVTKEDGWTRCRRLQTDNDLPRITEDLGLLPSHTCMSNCILFVEGPSDRIILSRWCEMAGMPIRKPLVHIDEMGGKSEGRRKADWWGRVAKALPRLGLVLVFDGDLEEREFKDIQRAIGPENRAWQLEKGTIEDYYPLTVLREAVEERYHLSDENREVIGRLQPDHVAKKVDDILGKQENWKVPVAEYVASSHQSDDGIPADIRNTIREITDFIKRRSVA